jgi:prepilin-type processing-associated H-X9-DG protein
MSHGTTGTGCCGVGAPHWSWIARILPYIEQDNVYKAAGVPDQKLNFNPPMLAVDIKTLRCPSDPATLRTRSNSADLGGTVVAVTNYKGNAGANWGSDFYPNDSQFATGSRNGTAPNDSSTPAQNGLERGDGIFWRGDIRFGNLRLTDILDGDSNTFMIGEDLPDYMAWNAWAYANGSTATCAIPPNAGIDVAPATSFGDWPNRYSFRSRHAGGLQFALADGSVRWVNETVPLQVYRAMATRKGLETLNLP